MTAGHSWNPFRRQLPARSPVPARAVWGALRGGGGGVGGPHGSRVYAPTDPRGTLAALLAREHRAHQAYLVGSGTQALTLALEAARLLAGRDEAPVALPAYTCFDVATAAVGSWSPVRLYDVDPQGLGPDPDSLERALADGARVVVLAPLFGLPLDWTELEGVLNRWDAVVVEDAAQAHGARWRGEPHGAWGRLAVLSFGRGKGWTGTGRGGALLARDPEAAAAVDHFLAREGTFADAAGWAEGSHRGGEGEGGGAGGGRGGGEGRTRAGGRLRAAAGTALLWGLARPGWYRIPRAIPALGLGETRYREPGAVEALPAGAAGALLAARPRAETEVALRRQNAAEYRDLLETRVPGALVRLPVGGAGGWLRFPLRLPGGMAAFRNPARARRLGAEAGYPLTLDALPALEPLLRGGEAEERGGARRFAGARELVETLVTLPTHGATREGERRALVGLVPVER